MAFVQGASGSSGVNIATAAYPAANTGGNCLIVAAMAEEPFGGFQTLAIEDTQGNVWIPLTSPPAEENNILPGAWICSSCNPGANTVTVTYGNPSDGYGWGTEKIAIAVTEWAGLISLDAHAVISSTSTATSTTSVTTSESGDILIGLQMIQGEEFTTLANSSGYTSDVSLVLELAGIGNQMGFGVYDTVAGAAGEYSLTATSDGGWSYGYLYLLAFTASVALTAQTITFPAISNHPDTDAPFALAATASSGLAVSYSVVSGPATVAGNTVTLTGGDGVVTIQATQAGNGTYSTATPVNQTFTVTSSLTAQSITFPAVGTHHPADAPFALAATASSGLAVSYAVTSGPATVSGNTVTLTGGTGSVTIQATQAGNGTYAAATPVSQSFAVSALTPQTITFPSISNGAANDPPFVLIGTSDSGLALSYAVTSGLATISGNTVTVTGVGVVTIQATQAGNSTYAPATPVSQSFTIGPAQRGCIAYDQIKASDRTGNGNQLLTYSPAPASATSPGTPGQVAFDAAGNWYFEDWASRFFKDSHANAGNEKWQQCLIAAAGRTLNKSLALELPHTPAIADVRLALAAHSLIPLREDYAAQDLEETLKMAEQELPEDFPYDRAALRLAAVEWVMRTASPADQDVPLAQADGSIEWIDSQAGRAGRLFEPVATADRFESAQLAEADQRTGIFGTAGQPKARPTGGGFAANPQIRKLVEEDPAALPLVNLAARFEQAKAEAEVAFRQSELKGNWAQWSGVFPWEGERDPDTTDCPWWVAGAEYVFHLTAAWRKHSPGESEKIEALLPKQIGLSAKWVYHAKVRLHDIMRGKNSNAEHIPNRP